MQAPAQDIAPGAARMTEVYLRGLTGQKAETPFDLDLLAAAAKARMAADAWDYVAGGAGRESTIAANRAALDRWRIVPRMARDCARRDLSVKIFGRALPSPFLTAPIGLLSLAAPEADLAWAHAAGAVGAPMIMSNQAAFPMEQIAACGLGPKWFQLYWGRSEALVESLVRRAEACGCEAVVVTLDTTLLGWRIRDLDQANLPFLRGEGIAQYTSDPVFRSLLGQPPEKDPRAAGALFTQIYSEPSLTWERLKTLRKVTRLPIVLKGVQHPEDAALAVQHGFDAIVVSNHGGRQIDGAAGSADQLPLCAERVNGKIPVLFDSGIRSGADAFKALALGADAVLVGRPLVWALAAAGAAGVEALLRNLIAEFDLTLGLAGWTQAAELDRSALSAC